MSQIILQTNYYLTNTLSLWRTYFSSGSMDLKFIHYESKFGILKFKMADPIWQRKMQKVT